MDSNKVTIGEGVGGLECCVVLKNSMQDLWAAGRDA